MERKPRRLTKTIWRKERTHPRKEKGRKGHRRKIEESTTQMSEQKGRMKAQRELRERWREIIKNHSH